MRSDAAAEPSVGDHQFLPEVRRRSSTERRRLTTGCSRRSPPSIDERAAYAGRQFRDRDRRRRPAVSDCRTPNEGFATERGAVRETKGTLVPEPIQTRTVVLLGAGIQEDSWKPVIRALQRSKYPQVTTDDAATTALAQLVYMMRFYKQFEASDTKKHGAARQETIANVTFWRTIYENVCAAICEELTTSETNEEMKLRDNFETVWNKFMTVADNHCLVTTNWDRTIANEVAKQWEDSDEDTVRHLHGDCRDRASLLLPTEVASEPYKTLEQCAEIASRRIEIVRILGEATRVVIYGLALSPLDIELCCAVTMGMSSGNVKELWIIDPDYVRVANRLRVLLPNNMPKFITCDPRDL